MKIIVKANGGLGNRMRVLASCIALSQRLRREVEILWVNNEELNCSFVDLFQPIAGLTISEKKYIPSWNRLGLKLRKRAFVKEFSNYDIQFSDAEIFKLRQMKSDLVKLIKDANTVYIDTCESFYGDESFLAFLLPKKSITKLVQNRFDTIGTNYVGVHIRRGDNEKSKEISTSAHFLSRLEELQHENFGTKFYLSTDDIGEASKLKNKFLHSLYHFQGGLTRNKPADIRLALVDLMMLAKSKKILGSYWSSFSEVASAYGGVEIEFAGVDTQKKQHKSK